MRLAEKKDLETVIEIICQSFTDNPHINQIIKNDSKRDLRLRILAKYAFYCGLKRKGVYLTEDNHGVVILYKNERQKTSLLEILQKIDLAIRAVTLRRAWFVNKLESSIIHHRKNTEDHLHLWFFGVSKTSIGSGNAREMMKFSFSKSLEDKLPIYCETSVLKNNIVYNRYGFSDYQILETGINDLKIWFMRRDWSHCYN